MGLFRCDSLSWGQRFSTFRKISVPSWRPKQFDPWSWRSYVPSQHPESLNNHAMSNSIKPDSVKIMLSEPQFFHYTLFLLRMRSFLGNRLFIQICKYHWNWILKTICFYTWSCRGTWCTSVCSDDEVLSYSLNSNYEITFAFFSWLLHHVSRWWWMQRCRVFGNLLHTDRHFVFTVPCIVTLCWKDPTRCNSMQVFIYCKYTLHVSGVHRTHRQENMKL